MARFDAERQGRLTKLSNLGGLGAVTFASLSNLAAQSILMEASQSYATNPNGWLVIVGPAGSGKTRLAAAIANERIADGQPVFFVTVADLLDHLRSTFAPDSDVGYDQMFEQVRSTPLLILDDLGNESATPWAQEKLAQILGHRYNEKLPTIVTTKGPISTVDERISGRLTDPTVSRILTLQPNPQRDEPGEHLDTLVPGMTFDTFDAAGGGLKGPIRQNVDSAFRLATDFAEHPEGWVVFLGAHGSGKTHLAAAIAARRREEGDDVAFVLVPKLLYYLRSTFGQPSREAFETIDRLSRIGLLVLDDLDESGSSKWAWDTLDLILNQRTLTRLPTVLTTTMSPEDMDPRLYSRLSDIRLSTIFEILAPDYRTGRTYPPDRSDSGTRRRTKPKTR